MAFSPPCAGAPSALELAILGELWAVGGTCATLTALPLTGRSSLGQRWRACEQLGQRGWLTYAQPIAQVGLSLTGKTLLGLDLAVWPVTPDERWILRSCQGGRIGPGQIHRRVPVAARQRLLERLAEQGLIVVYDRAIAELALTAAGRQRAVALREQNLREQNLRERNLREQNGPEQSDRARPDRGAGQYPGSSPGP